MTFVPRDSAATDALTAPLGSRRRATARALDDGLGREVGGPSDTPVSARMDDPDRLLTFLEGCSLLRMGRRWTWSRCNDGTLPHLRLGRSIRFRRSALLEFVQRQERMKVRR
jgi:excisionase family DNA binding protein